MTLTGAEFSEIVNFAGMIIYSGYYIWNYPLFTEGSVTITILEIMLGFFIVYIILDKILEYKEVDN